MARQQRRLYAVALVAGLVALVAGWQMRQADATYTRAEAPQAVQSGPLDGRVYEGRLRTVDGNVDLADDLIFANGHFWSTGCIECGFAPGAYWSRRNGDRIEFRGALTSPERGDFTYEGYVEGDEIRVRLNWLRERWYWTLDRDYTFEGRLSSRSADPALLTQARARAAGEARPDCPG